MKWIQGIKFRVLKKRLGGYVNWDGCSRDFKVWGEALDEVMALKPGDPIVNPYRNKMTTVAEVKLEWSGLKGVKGTYVSGFMIVDPEGFIIYDPPSELAVRYPDVKS